MKRAVSLTQIVFFSLVARAALADTFGQGQLENVGSSVYGGTSQAQARGNLAAIIGQVISVALGMLGIIFVVLIVYAGYLWMTARGEEAQVEKAKDTLQRAIIGLIITIAAYAIATFIFVRLAAPPPSTP